jgi:hypothetical protein
VATKIPNIVLIGDFNADLGTQKTHYDTLNDFLSVNNLTQHIREPTRITSRNATKLDLILTNLPKLVINPGVGAPVHENDHCTIFGTLNLKTIRRQPFERDMWNFKNTNFDLFREELSNVNWDTCLESDNIDEICDSWTATFMEIAERIVTKKRVKVRPCDKNWYNNYLRHLRIIKDRVHGQWVKFRTPVFWENYKTARNTYFQECDRLKLEYEEHIYGNLANEITRNPKKWWTLVGEVMGSSKKSSYPVIIKDGVQCLTDQEKAQAFNETFLASSKLTGDNFDLPEGIPDIDHDSLDNIIIKEKDVEDVIKNINTNKAYGPDNISPKLIKEGGPAIVKILTKIFNKSLSLAKFPSLWKKANVLPIYKKAEDFITTNYRPVSLLSILAKIFEKVVFKYLFAYFRDNFLISIWQSGFVPGYSTITQFTEIYDQFCKAVNGGKEIRVVFLDISKAFDRVWHAGLLHKLKSCGITGKLLEWLRDYLTDRHQRVIINGQSSTWGHIKAGVPQGSVLGPLLFLIFINDIAYVVRHCKIRLFADDTCLYIEIDDPDTQAVQLDEDLESLNQWAKKWHVDFSPPKTKELVISRKREPPTHPVSHLDNQPIQKVTQHKHLGLNLTSDLTWAIHIKEIADKANRRLGILRSLKYKLDRLSLERIYMGFIRPLLEYGDIVWDCPTDVLNPLEVIQRNAARVVVGATARCSTQGLYDETSWEPLQNRREFHRLSLMYNIVQGKSPSYLIDLVPDLVGNRTRYMLRNRGDLDPPVARLNVYAHSFFPTTTNLWNNLRPMTRNAPSLEAFKAHHKVSLPKKNALYYYGSRFEATIHARMRIGNSPLNAHLSNILNVIPSPLCSCQSGEEDTKHYFFVCPLYEEQRTRLASNLLPFIIDEVDPLLFGFPDQNHAVNLHIFSAVHTYMRETKRFI